MSVIRLRALEILGALIERQCPELEGAIRAGPVEAGVKQVWPSLTINPVSFKFYPDQDGDIHAEVGDSIAVFNVGRHEAVIQLRAGARTANQRAELEHGVSQLFLSQEGRPGILVAHVPSCNDAQIAFEMDTTEWQDEFAFDKKWFSMMTVALQMPALVERGGTYTIDEIRLSLTEDMTTTYDSLPASAIETISVDENGDVTVSSPTP